MQVVLIKRHNIRFDRIILIEIHLGYGDRAIYIRPRKTELNLLRLDRSLELDQIVRSVFRIRLSLDPYFAIIKQDFIAVLIPVSYLYIAVMLTLRRHFLQRDPIHLISLVKLISDPMVRQRVVSSAVPGREHIMGYRIVVHRSPCRSRLFIQRAVLHRSLRYRSAGDMSAYLAFSCDVDQLILRHLRRIRIYGLRFGCQRRLTLT